MVCVSLFLLFFLGSGSQKSIKKRELWEMPSRRRRRGKFPDQSGTAQPTTMLPGRIFWKHSVREQYLIDMSLQYRFGDLYQRILQVLKKDR